MKKDPKMMRTEELLEKLENIKTKYLNQHKEEKALPYFKRIIEELQKITTIKDIENTIKILAKLEKNCSANQKDYPNSKFMPIISLFITTKSFLQYQKDNNLLENFSKIHNYDFNSLISTKEDEIVLSDSTNNLSSSRTTPRLTKSYSLNDLNKVIEKQEIAKKIKEMDTELSNFNKSKENEISAIKAKWWYPILKFFSCGLWESSKIKEINEKYSIDNYNKKFNENQRNKKELEYLKKESYVTKKPKDKKWKSLNDLSNVTQKETKNHTLTVQPKMF